MLYVKLYSAEGAEPEQRLEGIIRLENGRLVGEPPDNALVKYALRCGVYMWETDTVITHEEPEKWLRNLWRELHGSTAWASDATEDA